MTGVAWTGYRGKNWVNSNSGIFETAYIRCIRPIAFYTRCIISPGNTRQGCKKYVSLNKYALGWVRFHEVCPNGSFAFEEMLSG